jgi:hypothetical protein
MRWFLVLRMGWRSLFGRPSLEEEMAGELRFHLEQQIAENRAAGMAPDEARRAARALIGASTR